MVLLLLFWLLLTNLVVLLKVLAVFVLAQMQVANVQMADAVLKWWVARSRMTLVDVARCRSSFVVGGGEVADESVRCCEVFE